MIKILYTLLGKMLHTKMVNNFKPETWGRASKRDSKKKDEQKRGNDERAHMDARSQEKISFGTMSFRRPSSTSRIKNFTLALPKSIKKCDFYTALAEALGDSWGTTRGIKIVLSKSVKKSDFFKAIAEILGDNWGTVRSTHIVLSDPPEWRETRKRIREAFAPFIIEPKEED